MFNALVSGRSQGLEAEESCLSEVGAVLSERSVEGQRWLQWHFPSLSSRVLPSHGIVNVITTAEILSCSRDCFYMMRTMIVNIDNDMITLSLEA